MNALTGTLAMVRFILRRDRIRIPIWIAAFTILTFATTSQVRALYPTTADLAKYAATVEENPAIIAFQGPTYALDTYGGRMAFELTGQSAIAIALMALLAMSRHLRAEEESGRAELLRATVLGRHATLAATLLVVSGTSALIGAAITIGLLADGLPLAGSVAMGAGMASVGVVFAAIGAVTSQVTEHSRGASGLALAALGAAYVLRVVGDIGSGAASWLSPIGWAQGTRSFGGERWWPLLLALAVAAVLVVAAMGLGAVRDLGAGLVPTRPGPARGSTRLGTPLGLAFRLQRATIVAWSAGLLLFGAAMGSIADSADDLIGDNPDMRDFIARAGITDLVDSFLATMLVMLALTASGFAIQSVLRLRTEETSGRSESLLATTMSRARWAGANLAVTVFGTVVVLGAAGLGTGAAHALQSGDVAELPRVLGAALAHVPAVGVLVGAAALLFGVVPRVGVGVWGLLVISVIVGVFGGALDLPEWFERLSPFDHVPQVPAAELALTPLVALTAVAGAGIGAGLLGYRARDAV